MRDSPALSQRPFPPDSPMALQQIVYEEVLVRYTDPAKATELLRQYRPYLETIPSMRRPTESLITIPMPIAQIQRSSPGRESQKQLSVASVQLPCDLAFLMCDPEWKVKTDVEILIFIHRPGEHFTDLLNRWRQTQVLLQRGYHWEMPQHCHDMFNEGAERRLPLFVLLDYSTSRMKRGMQAAQLPYVLLQVTPQRSESTKSSVPQS